VVVPLAAAVGIVLIPADAHAYIDPGTGSLIYQTALAILIGVGVYFRHVWGRLARTIGAIFRSKPGDTSGDHSKPAGS